MQETQTRPELQYQPLDYVQALTGPFLMFLIAFAFLYYEMEMLVVVTSAIDPIVSECVATLKSVQQ